MYGPGILARFLQEPGPAGKYGNHWQYHSRSDRHSKVGSWGVALDLLATSSLLRRPLDDGKVVLAALPIFPVSTVGAVMVALEAKATAARSRSSTTYRHRSPATPSTTAA